MSSSKLAAQVAQLRIPLAAANVFIPGGHQAHRARRRSGPPDGLRDGHARPPEAARREGGRARQRRRAPRARRVLAGRSHRPAGGLLPASRARRPRDTASPSPSSRCASQETNIINTAREGLALVKAVDRPEIRLLVDYYHLAEEGESADIIARGREARRRTPTSPTRRAGSTRSSPDESAYAGFFENLCKIGYSGPPEHRGLHDGLRGPGAAVARHAEEAPARAGRR